MTKIITIPKELRDNIQRANIEKDSRKEIIVYILENNLNVSSDRINQYQKEYEDKFFLFEFLKQELENTYIKPLKLNYKKWSLDYSTCQVSIDYD